MSFKKFLKPHIWRVANNSIKSGDIGFKIVAINDFQIRCVSLKVKVTENTLVKFVSCKLYLFMQVNLFYFIIKNAKAKRRV